MEPNRIIEWWTETQKVQQQQQMQALQQLLNQLQERQEQAAREPRGAVMGAVAGTPGVDEDSGARLPIRLTKLGPDDDPEAFLVTFERVATAARWPQEHWATLLAPYLSGPAQLAYRGMSARDALCYYKVKEAVLDQLGVTPESHRRRFREARYDPLERPRAVAQRVKEAGMRWLEPENKTGTQVADMVILEQYMRILPTEGQR
ncbi:SCAN domain-containing protein 1-like [Pelodiscus sinensis]|uniref:SCAN domain-containing protein 1-like n=1 Tax=Pelodiscus sinensis TaxID=13735 RepID=UPI003F6D85C9